MISRRNFISIIMMMAVIFLLFHFSQIVIDNESQFDVNAFTVDIKELPSGQKAWKSDNTQDVLHNYSNNGYVLLFTSHESNLLNIISQWCDYTKRNLVVQESLEDFAMPQNLPDIIILDSLQTEIGLDYSYIDLMVGYNVPILFCNLPDATTINSSQKMKDILGIKEVRSFDTPVNGIEFFDGFFLGGNAIYEAKTEEEEKRQDFELSMPWFVTTSGTKTYAVGLKDEEKIKREDFPGVIWRNCYKNTFIFAVNGDYVSTLAGLGILDSIMYESSDYELYPVINAQNITIVNFPGFSAENQDELMRIYSRNPQMTFRDIMWPGISAMAKNDDLTLTCLFHPQYDYEDEFEPDVEELSFYLQQLKQIRSEAGIALKYKDGTEPEFVMDEDYAFYKESGLEYDYHVLYVEETELDKTKPFLDTAELLKNTRTVVSEYSGNEPLISYWTNDVTLQMNTGGAAYHSFKDNIVLRSLQTSLGYSNVFLDMHEMIWPEDVSDQWQHLFDDMTSNVHTFWANTGGFDKTTLSESDLRVRNFLNLNYKDNRIENTIYLQVENFGTEAWFLLRTHEEKPISIEGGTYECLENNVYLIHVLEPIVKISLQELSLREQGDLLK